MGLGLMDTGMHFESDGEDNLLPTMSYEDFEDGFATDDESNVNPEEKERPRGYKNKCKIVFVEIHSCSFVRQLSHASSSTRFLEGTAPRTTNATCESNVRYNSF
jgi:hypothetical protein